MKIINKIKNVFKKDVPWRKYYTDTEWNKSNVPNYTLYDLIKISTEKYSNLIALNYFDKEIKYKEFLNIIDKAALSFKSLGIRRGDVVSILLPNTPEALISLFAINKIGAIAEMIHPLSSENEIKTYLNNTGSVMLIILDSCYSVVKNIIKDTNVYKTIIVSPKDSMPFFMALGYVITKGYKIEKPINESSYINWKDFIRLSNNYTGNYESMVNSLDPAVILHSGGTTGTPKSIVLNSKAFISLALSEEIMVPENVSGETILGILPIFHGFGLSIQIINSLSKGVRVILIPQFDVNKLESYFKKYHPSIIFGVPTLFEAISNMKGDIDLSNMKIVVCGGDKLSSGIEVKINNYLKEHNSRIKICQGYGMTESLAAVCVGFKEQTNKPGSIGIPLPGTLMKIVKVGTLTECKPFEEGEIVISGPTVMMGYLDNEKETNEVLKLHDDNKIWLHTGDLGYMDNDGVFFYVQRIKRMIISSGFNVYPSQIEEVISRHKDVLNCSVIGIPHKYKVEVPKAFIVLKSGIKESLKIRNEIKELCLKNLAKYSQPYELEFRETLPKTKIGKIDFKKLQEEEHDRLVSKLN